MIKWLRRRRSAELTAALEDSERRLAETEQAERDLEPKLRQLERAAANNRIYEAIVATFRVAG